MGEGVHFQPYFSAITTGKDASKFNHFFLIFISPYRHSFFANPYMHDVKNKYTYKVFFNGTVSTLSGHLLNCAKITRYHGNNVTATLIQAT